MRELFKSLGRLGCWLLLLVCVMFWAILGLICLPAYLHSGMEGIKEVFVHIAKVEGPLDYLFEPPRWDLIILNLLFMLALTIIAWLGSRRVLRQSWNGLKEFIRSVQNPPPGGSSTPREP